MSESSCDEELSSIMSKKCHIGKTANNSSVRSFDASRMFESKKFQQPSSSLKGASNSHFGNSSSSAFRKTSASLKKSGKDDASKSLVPASGFEFNYSAPMRMSREDVHSLLNKNSSNLSSKHEGKSVNRSSKSFQKKNESLR